MIAEIETLILKLRKEVYGDLSKGKEIMPKGYFFVEGKNGLTEIIIPGVEFYFRSPQTKNLLRDYVEEKWRQYKQKDNYVLVAVMLMSDQWMAARDVKGLTDVQIISVAKTVTPSREKDRMEFITFQVYAAEERKIFAFRYIREGNKIRWAESMEDAEMANFGRFKDMFPII